MRNKCGPTSRSGNYESVFLDSIEMGETNDCSVKAAVILTGIPYRDVHAAFESSGRKRRGSTSIHTTREAYPKLGFQLHEWTMFHMSSIQPPDPGVKYPSTYHPIRYPEIWHPHFNKKLLIHSRTHAVAWVNGRMHCWAENRSLRIKRVWEVLPL